jgi:hypothetical protein
MQTPVNSDCYWISSKCQISGINFHPCCDQLTTAYQPPRYGMCVSSPQKCMCARILCNVLHLNMLHHPLLPAASLSRPPGPSPGLLCVAWRGSSHCVLAWISLCLFVFGTNFFAVQQHYSTLLWISVCIIIIFSPRLLPVLLLLQSSGYSLMVLSLFYLLLCPALSSSTYVDLCGSCFFVVQLWDGVSTDFRVSCTVPCFPVCLKKVKICRSIILSLIAVSYGCGTWPLREERRFIDDSCT